MNALATVVTLTGRAWAVTADGQRRKLKEGDRLRGDEMLVTEPGARVDLDFDNNQMLTFLGEQQQNIGEAIEFAQAELPPSAPRPAAEGRQQPQAQPAQADGEPEGHKFVQLVRINEIIEADGITPLTIARIQEVLRPLGMSLPERVYDLDEWREHRGGDERYEDAPAARHPGLTVELQGAGPDGIYSEAEIGTDGTVPAEVTLDDKVRVGDRLVIKDGKGNTLLDRPVTQDDLDNGVTVEVPVVPGDRTVTVEATVTTPRGYTGQDRDDKPVDNLPPDEVTILPPQDSEDAESINLDLGSYFEDNVDGKDLTYDVTGLPPGLSFDPDTGIVTGTIDRSASQGGPDDDGIYKVTVTITDKVGNQTTIDFDWTVTNPEPEARDDRQTIDEDTVATGNVLTGAGNDPGVDGSDSDPDGDDLTVTSFTIGNDPTVYPADGTPVSVEDADGNLIGEITLNENGDYSFTPVPDWNGSVPDIHYTISDGEGGEDEARLSITVAPVNDPVELENIPDPNDPNDPSYPAVNDPTDPNDPARGNANDHVVFESALPGGSDQSPNQADLKVESSFTINAPDGLHGSQGLVLTYTNINGESRTLNLGKKQIEQLGSNNQTVDTQYGKLVLNGHTLNADGTISIDYEYTLERAPEVGGDHVDDRINIAVRDSDAHHPSDTDSKDLVIRIIDDAPVARNDANGIDEDTAVPVTGNVIANGSTGDVADTQGADGATVTGVTAGDQTAGGHVADGGVAGNIIGDYGTLVLNADGSYSYELDNSNLAVQGLHPDDAPLTDVFTYTITDADGDQSTATLTITVNGSNDGVTVTVPDPNDPADPNYPTINDPTDPNDPARGNVNDHVVFESGLAGGSATNADDTRVVSSFTLSALDGLDDTAAITIEVAGNSLTLNKAEVEDLANSSQSISTEYGELVLNGYTPNADGSISIDYQYTLTSAPDNTGGNGVHTDDIISIIVNDRDTDSDSQDLVIRIIDDAPVARDDANAIDEDETSVSGNVIAGSMTGDVADTEGADGATVTAIVSDNDATSTATTNIDGDLVIVGEFGTLIISPDGSYTYALNNDNAEVNALKDGETLTEQFSYTLTDVDGDTGTARLTITINGNTDGAPTIVPEDVNGPDVPADITTQGHVTVHERGLTGADSTHINDGSVTITAADGLQSITVGGVPVDLAQLAALDPNDPATHIEIDTPQGKLTLTGFDVTDSVGGVPTEGELQFTCELEEVQNTPADPADPDVGRNSTETIPLIVTDAGGGTGTGDLVINIIDDVPVAVDDTNVITEDQLAVTGNVIGGPSAAAGDEADTQGADGATVTEISNAATGSNMTTLPNGDLVIEGQYGTLTIRPDGFYTYELNNEHPEVNALKDGSTPLQEVFTYTLTDGDGDSDTADLTITINGRTDGEPSIVPEDDNGNGAIDGHNTVNESGLAGGSTAGDGSNIVDGTIQISAGDGLASITIGGQTFDLADLQALSASTPSAAIPVEGGTLVLTDFTPGTSVGGVPTSGTLEYTYTLTSERTHSGSEDQSLLLDIPLSVTDAGNGTANGTLTIQVVDDAPQASDDTNSITEDDLSVVGNVIDGDAAGDGADIGGADSATITDISSTSGNSADDSDPSGVLVIEGEYGTLTIQPNGEYEYVLNNDNAEVNKLKDGETLTEEFTYTLTDTDGDSDTARLTITINGRTDASPSIVPEDDNGNGAIDGHNTVNESGLRDPADADTSNIVDGSIQISAGDGLASISIGGQTFSLADLQALSASTPSAAIPVEGGTLVLTGFTPGTSVGGVPTSGTLEYTYTLTSERAHSGSEDQSLLLDIPLSVTDAGNETVDGTLTIQVMDDVPTAVADIGNVTEGATLIVDAANGVLTNDTAGADGWHALGAVVGVVAGDAGTTSSGGVGGRIDGQYGYLILNADGSYEYVSTADAVTGDEVDVFTYTVRDGDGDLSHTTLTINVADVTLTPVTTPDSVNESGLVGGSTEGDNSHITSGQVNLPPELEVIPDSGTTTYGTFTIDEDGNYTYTLTGTTSGDATTDSFTYVTTDANGNTVTNTVTIDIVDDEPVAVDDANSITEDEVSVTGNVIGGPSASTDDAADTEGADGATVTEISSAYGSMIAQPNGDLVIEGQYGKLTIRPDGFYTYELNNDHPDVNALKDGVDLQDVFTYTLTDGDGDSDTADLTITINGRTDGTPDLNITDHNGLDVGHNSIAEDATAPVTGEFTVTAPDGLEEITIGGITVTEAELADLTGNPVTIPGTEGTLTLTGYDPDTGKVTYEYQQTGNNKDHSGGDNSVTDHFPITVTDKGGDTSAPSDLVILITDTAPVANPDTGSIDEDGAALIGNVITDAGSGEDEIGADLTTVTGVTSNNDPAETATDIGGGVLEINGEYGTLTIQPDGSYTYELHDSAKVNALKDGDVRQEVFEYTITDSDGDSDNTTLTITINGKTDGSPSIVPNDDNGNGAIDGHNTVNESGLAGGSSAGDGSNIVDGTIQISAGDGLASISIAGQSVDLDALLNLGGTPVVIPVEGGTLELTGFIPGTTVEGVPTSGELQYSYTLTGERTHSGAGNDDVLLDIPLSVTDAGNETVNGTLTIQVVDDVPTAEDDTADVAAGEFELEQNGNVLTNDTEGADGARVTSVTPDNGTETSIPGTGNLVIDGAYGKLTIHSDGSYSYQRNPGTEGGVEDVFEYTITDGDGDTSSASLTISIADSAPTVDIPSAGSATTTVHESGLPDGSDNIPDRATTSGSIEFNSADGLGTVSLGGHTLTETDQTFPTTGPAGSLTARYEYDPVTGKGTIHYSYTLKETTSEDNTSASFPVEITDQDGDAAPSGNLVINIVDDTPTAAPDQATVTEGATLTVDAANGVLENDAAGADGWHDSGNAVVDVASNNQPSNTASTVGGALVIQGEYGTLTIAPDGSYTYESRANAVTGDEQDVFTYTVRDADGDETTATLTINISDVTGISRDTPGTVDEAGLPAGSDSSSDKETTGGSLNLADGWTVDPSSVGNQSSGIGTLTINADGSYSYELTSRTEDVAGVEETDTFTYTARDQYGNTVINTVTITIIDDVPSVTLTGNALGEVQVDETSMGTSASADFSGAFIHHFGADRDNGDGLVYALEVETAATGLVDTLTGQDITLVDNGGVIEGQNADGDVAFTISVDANGEVTLAQSRPLQHTNPNDHDDVLRLPDGSLRLTASVTDGDGDTDSDSVDIGGRFSFRDDGPRITANPDGGTVDEARLERGSGVTDSSLTVVSNSLNVNFGADGAGNVQFTESTKTALEAMELKANNVGLEYEIEADGHTLTAYRGAGRSDDDRIFTVEITNPTSNPGYRFTLEGAIDHVNRYGDQLTGLDLEFEGIRVTDRDGDSVQTGFEITVMDDAPDEATPQEVEVDEDSTGSDAANTFNTNADATGSNTTVGTGSDGPQYGTATVNPDGTITYVPDANYSGKDTFTYTTVTDNETKTFTVEVTVNPAADAPDLPHKDSADPNVSAITIVTPEDTAVALGLKLPVINDNTDQNGSAADSGDNPERLGAITLTLEGAPAGTTLSTTGFPTLTPNGDGEIIIVISSDGTNPDTSLHHADMPGVAEAGVYYLTQAQYEAITANPAADRHENFEVVVKVSSYEVDDNRVPLPDSEVVGSNGAESTQTITVDVQAVTDAPELILAAPAQPEDAGATALTVTPASGTDNGKISATIAEDTTLNLQAVLGESFQDTDGSESYWYSITGLPEGTVVTIGSNSYTAGSNGTVTMPSGHYRSTSDGADPAFTIRPPLDYSNDAPITATITLHTRDADSDSSVTPATESVSVDLELRVTPVAGDVAAGDVSTTEDTPVAFLQHVRVTDTGTGSEVIDSVAFEIPAGWTVTEPTNNGGWHVSGSGASGDPYTIVFDNTLDQSEREAVLDGFLIKPPAHSSKDEDIVVRVTSTDTNGVGANEASDTVSRNLTIKVEVTPVAERTDTDSDGQNGNDVTMTRGRDYTTPGEEDEWFMLGQEAGFNLKDGWSNEDGNGPENGGTVGGSEQTFALLTPSLIAGDGSQADASGSEFRWGPNDEYSEIFDGVTPVEVPLEYLDTLQFKAAPHFSGMFEIKVQAKTVDYDDDHAGDESKADTKLSGEATLTNVLIKPVADEVTLALNGRATGKEDEPIALNIHPTSSDPSETFNITISDIPVGAQLIYNGTVIYGINDVGGSVTINDFKQHLPLTITPPLHSNVDFTLRVQAQSVDKMTVDGTEHSDTKDSAILPIHVAVQGVADPAPITPTPDIDYSEADLDSGATTVALKDLLTATKTDNDGSETLTLRVSGLPEGFAPSVGTLLTPTATGAARTWVLTQAQFDSATIKVPANYSGAVTFQVASVTTENDGNSLTGTPVDISFTVTPSPEATMTTGVTVEEDVLTALDLNIVHQSGDTDETLAQVRIAESELVGKNFTLYLDSAGTQPVTDLIPVGGYYVLTPAQVAGLHVQGSEHLDGSLGSFNFQYQITDAHYGTVAAGNSVTSDWQNDTFTITATPVTDQPTVTITDITSTSPDGDPADLAVSLTNAGTVTVNLNIASPDQDGSEHLIRVVIDGVPDGVTVVGAEFITGNQWLLVYDGAAAKDIGTAGVSLPVDFVVSPQAGGVTNQNITLTVQVQDRGNQPAPGTLIEEDSISWQLNTNFSGGPGETPAVIKEWGYNGEPATEDTSFTLDDMFDAEVTVRSSAVNTFTITLEDVPAGTTVSGMKSTTINGETVWTASVTLPADSDTAAANLALENLMKGISITPREHSNSNNNTADPLSFKATLTATVVGGSDSETANDTPTIPVTPVTDNASFAISTTDPELNESDTEIPITLTVSNLADGAAGSIVGGNLYLQISADQAGLQGGSLTVDNTTYTLQSVTGVTSIPDGDYYVIDGVDMGDTLSLVYTPTNMTAGNVTVEAWVRNDEPNGGEITSKGTAIIPVAISNDGVEITSAPVTGVEAADSSTDSLIQLNLGLTLNDTDGSEEIIAILLANLPDGFQVYTGTSASDASQAEMADNAGGEATNTWVISDEDGKLPQYIGILPPQYWSGTLNGLSLLVESGEKSLPVKRMDDAPLASVTINPVANGITLTATTTFGSENRIIPLNLNSSMADMIDATVKFGETVVAEDTSQETTTLQLTGLGDHASFYIGTTQIHGTSGSHSVSYDAVSDTWTITGLTQNDLYGLGFKQARAAMTDQDTGASGVQIGVTAWTVDGTSVSASVSTTITTSISAQLSTSGNDTLIWTGNSINGRGGDDTIQLRFGESLDGTKLADKLSNIEVLDLSVEGANSITSLSAADVLGMTDDGNLLKIFGDSEDAVSLADPSAWTHAGQATEGGKTFDVYAGGGATLWVEQGVQGVVID
ncbi:VCBS domain-containing protein [Geopseudomonas aromaticivorans]